MDPFSIVACVATVVSAIASGAHLIRRLWNKLRKSFGSACTSIRYLQNMNPHILSSAIHSIFSVDQPLMRAAEKRYIGYVNSRHDLVEEFSDSSISDCSDCDV
ncbi:uncharacterized protein K441DRAFT_663778 [Cenococcum geophilum 1.58]|uniref:uncharacterized protein n=1 Tax=Cenococcum geophilum 1.58 TaxID=794803 RepID=UPI00358DE17C|nr:hypothetical protein K441DRAFT_663778 [Cenococcum geophilum 1.58]